MPGLLVATHHRAPEPPTESATPITSVPLSVCRMGRSAREAITNEATVKPIVIDLISYQNERKYSTAGSPKAGRS